MRYGELNERANRLAHYLIGQGVAPGDAVAILLPRSLELLVAQLAVAKCAAVYVPLDINAPPNARPSCWLTARPWRCCAAPPTP